MPMFDYHCPSCCGVLENCRRRACAGVFEAFFTSDRLESAGSMECPMCGDVAQRVWINAPGTRFDSVHEMPKELLSASHQLGVRFESRKQLEDYVKQEGLVAVSAKEFESGMPSSDKVQPREDPTLEGRIWESLKKNEEKLAAGTLKPQEAAPPPQEVFDHVKKQTGIDLSKGVSDL
jgi:hypothetical protein